MRTRTYNYIVNACAVIGIGSAFLFDRVGNLRWLAISVAILAGLIAGATYFYDRLRSEPEQERTDEHELGAAVVKTAEPEIKLVETGGMSQVEQPSSPPGVLWFDHELPQVAWANYPVHNQRTVWYGGAYPQWQANIFDIPRCEVSLGRGNLLIEAGLAQHELQRCVAEEVEKMYIPGDTVALEMVVTKEGGERSIMFVVHAPPHRGKAYGESYPYFVAGRQRNDLPWVDVDATAQAAS